jgi:large subunit ribosomal protein L23
LTEKSSRDIVKRPIVTEKTVENAQQSKYTFEVSPEANKIEIRKAIQDIFKVTVTKVTTINMNGKRRVRFDKKGRHAGYSRDWKKAVVTLKEGERIEIAGLNPFEV